MVSLFELGKHECFVAVDEEFEWTYIDEFVNVCVGECEGVYFCEDGHDQSLVMEKVLFHSCHGGEEETNQFIEIETGSAEHGVIIYLDNLFGDSIKDRAETSADMGTGEEIGGRLFHFGDFGFEFRCDG